MSIQANKEKPKVGEPVEVTITARYLNLDPSLLFSFQGGNAFRIKVIVPDGFVVTGGTYQDYIGDNLTPDHPYVTYTLMGYFTRVPDQAQFRLLRGGADANEQSLFMLKAQLALQVKPSDASRARAGTECTVISPMGAFDYVTCSQMSGWAFDRADLSQTLQVDIYVDGVLTYPGVIANVSRPDLETGFKTSAARPHGFVFLFPANAPWQDGKSHVFTVRICGVTSDVGGSPKTLNGCGSTVACTPPQSPTLTASNGSQLCNGAVTLTASGCSGTINWSTGATSTSISVSTAASYTATCTQNSCTSPAASISVSACPAQSTNSLMSGSCYTIQSQQNANLVQASGGAAQFLAPTNQSSQVWLAESVGSNTYKFTVQDGSRQALFVDGLSDGQRLKLGSYQADPRYQWTLESSASGGYRVYGGSTQNTWDYQGGGNALQLYGSNLNQRDGSWNQSYRRFSFTNVSCPTSTTTTTTDPPTSTTTTSTTATSTTTSSGTTTASLSVSPNSVSVGAGASSQAISVSSNVAWSVSASNSVWLSVSSVSGSGNGGFTISIAANGGSQRAGSVSVSAGDQTQTITITQAAAVTTPPGYLVSGSCYTIQSQQNANLVQANNGAAQFLAPTNQSSQIWLAESVGSNTYKFTVQDGSRQALFVDGLSDGQRLKLGSYQADPRYQWTLESSASGGYRVYGGSTQNTWDYQGGGNALQLYGSNLNQRDGSWNQSYRRFSFTNVSCPTSTTTATTDPPTSTTTTSTTATSTTTSSGTTTASLSVSPNSFNAGAGASSQAISVSSNVAWTVNTNNIAWITVSSPNGNGNGSFTINVAANSGSQRAGSVSVSAGDQTQTITITQAAAVTTPPGYLVSGSCYTIQSQQNANLVQASNGAAQFLAPTNQSSQVWLAESVGNNTYKFTVQDGSRQALFVDGLSDGQRLKLGSYQADPRYQWTLESSASGGYRVYGGSTQNTWDYQGGGNALQLYGSNLNQRDGSWNQSYRRFSFSNVSCPTSTTTATTDPPTSTTTTSTTATSTTTSSGTTTASLSVSPNSFNAGAGASSQVISVSSNVAWSVSTNNIPWLTVSSANGNGNGSFSINVAANSGQQRAGSVSVSAGDQTQTITITQAAIATSAQDCNLTVPPLAGAFDYTPFTSSAIPGNYIVGQENSTVKLELNLKEGTGANNGLAGGILGIWDKLHTGGPQNAISNPIFGPGNCGDCGRPDGTTDLGSGNQIALYRLPSPWNYNGVNLPIGDNSLEYGADNSTSSKLNQYGRGAINGATADYTSVNPAQWDGPGQTLVGDKFEKWVSVQGNEIKIWYQETLNRTAQTGANNDQSYPKNQEAPCLYANANLGQTVFYDGDAPYTNGQVRSIQLSGNPGLLNGQNYLTENWIAVIGTDGRGIGLIMETPISHIGQLGPTINNAAGTGFGRTYIGWHPKLNLDANIVWRHSVVEVIGTLAEIRQAAYNYTKSRYSATPEYRFNQAGRQLWSIENCSDPGYVSSRTTWPVTFNTAGAKVRSPAAAWNGANKKVYMRYRYTANGRSQATVSMQWRRARQSDAFPPSDAQQAIVWNQQYPDGSAVGPDYAKSATLIANGQWNTAVWDMSNMAQWKGIISEIIFKSDDSSANDTLEIEWISGGSSGPCPNQ